MSRQLMWILALCVMLIALFPGCRAITPAVTYYIMRPMATEPVSPTDTRGHQGLTIGIRSVELPGYINRTPMIKRSGQSQMKMASFHRWADYPDRLVPRVLAENLQLLLVDAQVSNSPWPVGVKPEVIVDFTFHELIGTTEKMMLLSAVWTITDPSDLSASRVHRTTLSEPLPGTGFDDLAAAHSRILATFCREVAESLHAFTQ